jgi:hypothetical protein
MNELSSLVLGWFLGIAGTLGVDRHKEWKKKRKFLAGLRIEFARLQANMAVLYWNLTDREGAITREEIEWVMSRTRLADEDEGIRKFRTNFAHAESFSDADIATLSRVGQKRKQLAISLRTYQIPFLEANLDQITSIDNSQIVANIFDVRQQLNMFNEVVADTREWHQMTFDSSVTPENHDRVVTLVEGGYSALRNRAKWTADSIESVLQEVILG